MWSFCEKWLKHCETLLRCLVKSFGSADDVAKTPERFEKRYFICRELRSLLVNVRKTGKDGKDSKAYTDSKRDTPINQATNILVGLLSIEKMIRSKRFKKYASAKEDWSNQNMPKLMNLSLLFSFRVTVAPSAHQRLFGIFGLLPLSDSQSPSRAYDCGNNHLRCVQSECVFYNPMSSYQLHQNCSCELWWLWVSIAFGVDMPSLTWSVYFVWKSDAFLGTVQQGHRPRTQEICNSEMKQHDSSMLWQRSMLYSIVHS